MKKGTRKLLAFILALAMCMSTVGMSAAYAEETVVANNAMTVSSWDGVTTVNNYTGDSFSVEFSLTNYWENGYNANVKVKNTGNSVIENWYLSFALDNHFSSIWNAETVSHDNGQYVIKNANWNADIPVGGCVEFGISVNETFAGFPKEYKLLGESTQVQEEAYSVEYILDSDWGAGFSARILLSNHTEETFEDWTLEFDFDREITSIWNGVIEKHERNHYVIKNAGYNANIIAGSELSFGFNGEGGTPADKPTNCKLVKYSVDDKNLGQTTTVVSPTADDTIDEVSVTLYGTENQNAVTTIEKIDNPQNLGISLDGIVGEIYSIESVSAFETATITFKVDKTKLGNTAFEDLVLMWYDEANKKYMAFETVLDEVNSTVSTETTHFCLVAVGNQNVLGNSSTTPTPTPTPGTDFILPTTELTSDYISNDEERAYVNKAIKYYLTLPEPQKSFDNEEPVIFLFEGASNNEIDPRIDTRTRSGAVCVVVKKYGSNNPCIVYFNDNCTTLPDNQVNGVATTKDGIYHVVAVDHGKEKEVEEYKDGKYAALNVQAILPNGSYSGGKVPAVKLESNERGFEDTTASGINVHTRTTTTALEAPSGWSKGCILIDFVKKPSGKSTVIDTSLYDNFLHNVYPDNIDLDRNGVLTLASKIPMLKIQGNKGRNSSVGTIVIDRYLFQDGMDVLYNCPAAVDTIVAHSVEAEKNMLCDVHTFSYGSPEVVGTAKTCTQRQYICEVCGYVDEDMCSSDSTHVYQAGRCATCGFVISCEHTYSDCLDSSCDICGVTRIAPDHAYTNCEDATCNRDNCNCTRYTMACLYTSCTDTMCSRCGYVREVAEHEYSDCEDATCNKCGATRTPGHTYSNCEDASCNKCGATRTPGHTYSNCEDTTCNNTGCDEVREALEHRYFDCEDTTCENAGCDEVREAQEHYWLGGVWCIHCGRVR